MVKRAVKGSERAIGGSRGQLGGMSGQQEDLGASQCVWEASQGVWRVKLGEDRKTNKQKNRLKSPTWYHRLSTPLGPLPKGNPISYKMPCFFLHQIYNLSKDNNLNITSTLVDEQNS